MKTVRAIERSIFQVIVLARLLEGIASAQEVPPVFTSSSSVQPSASSSSESLARAFADLIETAIPTEYEKRQDWGKTKQIVSGLKFEDFDIKRRRKSVKHGVWKHYKVNLVDPETKLQVAIENLHQADGSRAAFTLTIQADLATWGRAKIYQTGIHLLSVEMVGTATMNLRLDCEVGVHLESRDLLPTLVIDPRVVDAHLDLPNFRLHRISNAHGPLVKELGDEVKKLIERDLRGPKLVEKLNRSIEKKREQLVLSPGQLAETSWWPLSSLPDVAPLVR